MAPTNVELSQEDFAAVHPFGFIFSSSGELTVVGRSLSKRAGVEPGARADAVFDLVRPARLESVLDVEPSARRMVQLRIRHNQLELRGALVSAADGAHRVFLGSPVVLHSSELKQHGLRLSDFSEGDTLPDLLLSAQAQAAMLDDARRLSHELTAALNEANAASEAKARFLAIISHEIRTPMNGVGAMLDLLREQGLREDQHELIETMDQCSQNLLVLINDLLDYSRIEANGVELEREPTCVRSILGSVDQHFSASARSRHLDLRTRISDDLPHWLLLDPNRVRQVVSNLVSNAIKFTERGGIEVRASVREGAGCVEVFDTGFGVDPAARGQLFEPFTQADSSTTRRHGGSGLGLSICRQLARAMGGDVELVASSSNGSHFRFSFALEPCEAEALEPDSDAALDGAPLELHDVRILVAEDEPINQRVIKRLLEKYGAQTAIVGDGEQALQAVQEGEFDLILLDLMMPILGGLDAARAIRALGGRHTDLPIVAFSANAFASDHEAAREAGMSGFLEKPVRLAGLEAILREQLRR